MLFLETIARNQMDKKGKLPKDDDWHPLRSAAVASGAGLSMLASIAVVVWACFFFYEWLGTDPWGLILLSVIGAVGGLWSAITQILGKK
mgnify:CR=1 FL=1